MWIPVNEVYSLKNECYAIGLFWNSITKKLGIKENHKIKLVNIPEANFEWLENDIRRQLCKRNELPDFVHLFAKDNKIFETGLQKIFTQIKPDTIIWVSWYKKSSGTLQI